MRALLSQIRLGRQIAMIGLIGVIGLLVMAGVNRWGSAQVAHIAAVDRDIAAVQATTTTLSGTGAGFGDHCVDRSELADRTQHRRSDHRHDGYDASSGGT